MRPILKSLKVIRDLGLPKLWYYTVYQVGLSSGHYRRITPNHREDFVGTPGLPPFPSFPTVTPAQRDLTLVEADEIRRGYVRLFGGDPVPLDLVTGASENHWSALENTPPEKDIKFIWEPARFGWAITLARAYAFSGDSAYARDFWDKTLQFLTTHSPNLGRQWQSAQEVAIRMMALIFCDRILATSPSSEPENRNRLWQAIAEHAQRIPATLVYALAQNNNHLLSEAAGLYAAGLYLPEHPQANAWRQSGWKWLNWGFQHQIDEFGTYIQQSTNYHRLMLQLALYADHIRRTAGDPDWPSETRSRLSAATNWLWALTDHQTGRVPNLGANDSANIFPLSNLPSGDYRPLVDAAAKAFLNQDIYDRPNLAEMANWFDLSAPTTNFQKQPQAPDMLRLGAENGRAFLHTPRFSDRPSHADQLHTDLWWHGVNVALDPGTYQYNAAKPWANALATAKVHNTLTLDGLDQMLRAGRFLWLDWAQAEVLAHEVDESGNITRVTAEHNGYRKLGARHQRTLTVTEDGWNVADAILPYNKPDEKIHAVRLTWLLPDWTWLFETKDILCLTGPDFGLQLQIEGTDQIALFRGGETLHGELEPEPIWGWTSSTYGVKAPALLIVASQTGQLPLMIQSTWRFEL